MNWKLARWNGWTRALHQWRTSGNRKSCLWACVYCVDLVIRRQCLSQLKTDALAKLLIGTIEPRCNSPELCKLHLIRWRQTITDSRSCGQFLFSYRPSIFFCFGLYLHLSFCVLEKPIKVIIRVGSVRINCGPTNWRGLIVNPPAPKTPNCVTGVATPRLFTISMGVAA